MMRKLLAYFDKATVSLYFAQSVFCFCLFSFGENKHKLIEEKNHNGKIYGLYGQPIVYFMALVSLF